MKILYHHRLGSKDGQFVHVQELTRALASLGHEIVMVGPTGTGKQTFGGESGGISLLKRRMPDALYAALEFAYSVPAYVRLARAIRAHRPDVIYERYNLFFPVGVVAKRRYRLPLLLEVNAPLFDERSRYGGLGLKWLARWSERFTWRGADRVITVTRVLARRIAQEGVDLDPITVTPNGVDTALYRDPSKGKAVRRRLGLDNATVLGFVGFAREWHRLERVIDVLAAACDEHLHLLLVGDGPAVESIRARARERGVEKQITITGVIERDQIPDYVLAFDVALQPSVVSYASPLKLFEYMAAGCAIVAPDSDNIREVLTPDRDALLFPLGDADAFAAAIRRFLSDESLRRRLGRQAQSTLGERRLSWEANAHTVTQLAEGLSSPSGKADASAESTQR